MVSFSLLLEKRLLEWLSTLQSTFTGESSGNVLVFKPFSIILGLWKFFPKIFVKDRIEQFLKLLSTFSQNFAVFSIFFCFLSTFPGFERENWESLWKMVLQRSQKCNIVSERSFRLFFSFSVKMKWKSYRYGALWKNLIGFCPNINCRFVKTVLYMSWEVFLNFFPGKVSSNLSSSEKTRKISNFKKTLSTPLS